MWRDCVDLDCGFLGVPDAQLQKCQPEVDFLPALGQCIDQQKMIHQAQRGSHGQPKLPIANIDKNIVQGAVHEFLSILSHTHLPEGILEHTDKMLF